jgi:hypothetical protein
MIWVTLLLTHLWGVRGGHDMGNTAADSPCIRTPIQFVPDCDDGDAFDIKISQDPKRRYEGRISWTDAKSDESSRIF